MDNTVGSLTRLQKSVLAGSILGDGYLRIAPGRRDAFLEVNHSYRERAYVDWKYSVLRSIAGSRPKVRAGKEGRLAYRFYTKQHPDVTSLFPTFYRNGRKTVPEDLELDPAALAVWYMDDGSRCRTSDVYLNTQQFGQAEQGRLLRKLQKLGIEGRINRDKQYWRIRILKSSIQKFRDTVAEYVVPSLKYKIEL